jgi:hypothetical protein
MLSRCDGRLYLEQTRPLFVAIASRPPFPLPSAMKKGSTCFSVVFLPPPQPAEEEESSVKRRQHPPHARAKKKEGIDKNGEILNS